MKVFSKSQIGDAHFVVAGDGSSSSEEPLNLVLREDESLGMHEVQR